MGIFHIEKKSLDGKVVESYEFRNTILDAGLAYLTAAVGNDFNKAPAIGVGLSDITPDTNQTGLISPVLALTATFTPGTSTQNNQEGNKTFSAAVQFAANQAIGNLTEVSYAMNGINLEGLLVAPLNRTLFQTPGFLDTRFTPTPELDQIQNTDISNLTKVYGTNFYSETFTPSASATNLIQVDLSFASSGNPPAGLTVAIYTDSSPVSGTPNALLGTTTIAQFSEPVQRWRSAVFPSPISLTPGDVYHIVVSCPSTDAADSYDLFGSGEQQYGNGILLGSTNSGANWAPISPTQNFGFRTYYSTTGAVPHEYVMTLVQFDKETSPTTSLVVSAFPENNLDSTNTSQGTVRIQVPTYIELPPFTEALKLYKMASNGTYGLLATLNDVRQYFYDNGSTLPNTAITPPSATSITTPTGLGYAQDNSNGGYLVFNADRYYVASAVQQGSTISQATVGPFQDNVPGSVIPFYSSAYTTTTVPLSAAFYETALSSELHVPAPSSTSAQFAEYFTSGTLNPALWNLTNNNPDYFSIVKPLSTNESQLQMQIPGGTPFVISSTRTVRPGQQYYVNVTIPLNLLQVPFRIPGSNTVNPIYTNSAPNRIPLWSFINPANVNLESNDKRLSFEVGLYNGYRTEQMLGNSDTDQYSNQLYFCLYDNVGNTYFFNPGTDVPSSHSDGAYTFEIIIGPTDRTMTVNVLNPTTRNFQTLTSSVSVSNQFNPHTQYNATHTTSSNGGQVPGPATQTTNHFLIPDNYCFAIGNPSNDPLAFVPAGVNYVACNDSIYTITGLSPAVPVPAIAMRTEGYRNVVTFNSVPGARKYRLYVSETSGVYNSGSGNLVADYNTYFPAYSVQSTETFAPDGTVANDWFNSLSECGSRVRNWTETGVSYGIDSTSTGNTYSYALAGFAGSSGALFDTPAIPLIQSAPGSAEGYQVYLTATNQVLMFTFTGGGFQIVGETGPDRGIASLYIDGNFVENIDTYSAQRLQQQVLFTTSVLTPGRHIATIRNSGQTNDFSLGDDIAIDYFHITVPAIIDDGIVYTGAPLTTSNTNIAPVLPPPLLSTVAYNGNGPTVVVKDPQHTLAVTLTFSLINPNL